MRRLGPFVCVRLSFEVKQYPTNTLHNKLGRIRFQGPHGLLRLSTQEMSSSVKETSKERGSIQKACETAQERVMRAELLAAFQTSRVPFPYETQLA
jgi:hypothetical protein